MLVPITSPKSWLCVQVGRRARTGLRMMPTCPSPPLKFRTAGFPQYGFKASMSDRAFLQVRSLKLAPGIWSLLRGLLPPFARFHHRSSSNLCIHHFFRICIPRKSRLWADVWGLSLPRNSLSINADSSCKNARIGGSLFRHYVPFMTTDNVYQA